MKRILCGLLLAVSVPVMFSPAPSDAADGSCGHAADSPGYKVSYAFTTCGNAAGVKADLDFQSGQWSTNTPNGYVSQNVQLNVLGSGDYIILGYQRGPFQNDDGCYTLGTYDGNFTQDRLTCPSSPQNVTLQVQAASPASFAMWVYINGIRRGGSYDVGVNVFHLISTGATKHLGGANDTSKVVRFSGQAYLPFNGGSLAAWGTVSHCYVDGNNTFGQESFPSSHRSAIGPGAGSYDGCDSPQNYAALSTYGANGTW